ncbi:MAG: hypothetical protein JOZ47_07360 [Kutzneria sp.]|nr:hypothetical protein [Kutzneria sp.]MBV9844875.1 hypothetical protein [Kutzneria sp.]
MAADHTRIPRLIFIVQGVLVAALGVAGLTQGQHRPLLDNQQPVAAVLGLHLSHVHSLILVAAGALSVLMPLVRRLAGWWAILQFAAFAVLFNYGAAEPTTLGLDTPSHFVHLGLVTVAAVLGLLLAAPHLGGEH